MVHHEIVLETTKPETEWVRGRALRKVSATYRHGLAQRRIAAALGMWAEEHARGRVATEWRFRVTPPGGMTRPLVPDIAYVSFAALARCAPHEDVDLPRLTPTVAVEVLSPEDREDDVRDKIRTYLSAGTSAVIVVDPQRESASVHDGLGMVVIAPGDVLRHAALPDFTLELERLFSGQH